MGQVRLRLPDDLHDAAVIEARLAGLKLYQWLAEAVREKVERDREARGA